MSTYVQIDKNPDKSVGLDYPVRLGNKGYFKRTSTLIQDERNLNQLNCILKFTVVSSPDVYDAVTFSVVSSGE